MCWELRFGHIFSFSVPIFPFFSLLHSLCLLSFSSIDFRFSLFSLPSHFIHLIDLSIFPHSQLLIIPSFEPCLALRLHAARPNAPRFWISSRVCVVLRTLPPDITLHMTLEFVKSMSRGSALIALKITPSANRLILSVVMCARLFLEGR